MGKYSQFINFPIYLYSSKEVDIPSDEDVDAADTEDDVSEDASDEAEDDVDDEDGKPACSHAIDVTVSAMHRAAMH